MFVLKRQHIIFYTNHLRGPKGLAGARSWHQAKCLAENYNLTVILPRIDPVSSNIVTDEMYSGLDENKVEIQKVWTIVNDRSNIFSRAAFFLSATFSQFFKGLFCSKPDLVFSMSLPVTMLTVALIISRIRKAPLIVDVRDLPFETAIELGYLKKSWLVNFLIYLETLCLKKAASIVTNSPRYVPILVDRGISHRNIHLAYIGYDNFKRPSNESINRSRDDLIQKFQSPPRILAVYAGTIGYAFPVEEILEGAKLLKNNKEIGFVFLGDGQRQKEFVSFSKENCLNVLFLGRLNKNDVHTICCAADICLYPSRSGKFSEAILGNKVFDYLGAEKPIIYIGSEGAVSDIICELSAGVICPLGDPQVFVNELLLLTRSQKMMQMYAKGASQFREAGYTAQKSASILKALVDEILL